MTEFTEYYLMLPVLLWISSYAVIEFADRKLKKKFGTKSESFQNVRAPKLLALLLNSAATIGLIIYIKFNTVTPEASSYFVVPYFGIMSYFLTVVFREFKDGRRANGSKW